MSEETNKLTTKFVHLHNHTDYSLLDGAASIENYMVKAKEEGMDALAITDHGNMCGALIFYRACKKHGIKPIIGSEFYMNPPNRKDVTSNRKENHAYHLLLLATSDKGYHNLMKLSSLAYLEGYYFKPRIDNELLEKYNEDIICLSACLGGEILQLIMNQGYDAAKERAKWYKGVFGDRYYIELQDHGLPEQKETNPQLIKLAKELDIPLVCTNDIHYLNKDDASAQDILLCIGTGKKKADENRLKFPCEEFYFKSQQQMIDLFSYCPEAIENTVKIAERCNIEINLPGPLLPIFDIPEGFQDAKVYLRHLTFEGCKMRFGEITPELQKRLDYELDIILTMDFQGYFLIVQDYIIWAKRHDIPVGPGRGSGAGSLVAYCLEITDVDPIKYDLLFERFLNPERVSMPDFDIDFCYERRGEVIKYVTEHYGTSRVGQITTFGTLKTKAVVKDVARVLDISFKESNEIAKLIPDEPKLTVQKALDKEEKLRDIEQKGPLYEELFAIAKKLEGKSRHTSLHAAGVVIGQTQLMDYVPLSADSKTKAIATQYTMDQLEDCGLVKMDFLGLKTLTLIKHTTNFIIKKDPTFDIAKIDELDKKTFEMLCRGDSACVFQFESAGMQRILKNSEPSNIEDLVALNALYRPGPMDYIPRYIACKKGLQEIEYADPELEPILKNTYGVIVYQEQVMRVAQVIAGYSLGQADILRRIMGKKKVDLLAGEKVKFVEGAMKLGRTKEHAEDIFDMLAPFALYGFNKSHAVAYSILAYQTAFLKANYPSEFLAANLTNETSNVEKYKEYLALAETMKIKILAPDVNKSDKNFSVVDNDIVYGLSGIKNVGDAVTELIVLEREANGPYLSFLDFIERQKDSVLNSRVLESLIKAGAFDSLKEDRATLVANLEEALNYTKSIRAERAYGQTFMFEEEESLSSYVMRKVEPWSKKEVLAYEIEFLGFYASGHPLDEYKEIIKRTVLVNLDDEENITLRKQVNLVCLLNSFRIFRTKAGDKMGSASFSYYDKVIEGVIFPKTFAKIESKLVEDNILGVIGHFDKKKDDSGLQFIINDLVDPEELKNEAVTRVCLSLSQELINNKKLATVMMEDLLGYIAQFEEEKNSYPISLYIGRDRDDCVQAPAMYRLPYNEEVKKDLLAFDIVENAWYI